MMPAGVTVTVIKQVATAGGVNQLGLGTDVGDINLVAFLSKVQKAGERVRAANGSSGDMFAAVAAGVILKRVAAADGAVTYVEDVACRAGAATGVLVKGGAISQTQLHAEPPLTFAAEKYARDPKYAAVHVVLFAVSCASCAGCSMAIAKMGDLGVKMDGMVYVFGQSPGAPPTLPHSPFASMLMRARSNPPPPFYLTLMNSSLMMDAWLGVRVQGCGSMAWSFSLRPPTA